MASASDILRLIIQVTGDEDWGPNTEANLARIEEAIASEANINTTGGETVLTETNYAADQTRRPVLRITGVLASDATIQVGAPDSAKFYTIINATTGAHTATLRIGADGATFAVDQGYAVSLLLLANGTIYQVTPQIALSTGAIQLPIGYNDTDAVRRSQLDDRIMMFLSITTQTPPSEPSNDDAYYVPTGGTGAWSGQDGKIARYFASAWHFFDLPTDGMFVWVEDQGVARAVQDSTLIPFPGLTSIPDGSIIGAKLATNAIASDTKIADGVISNAKLANMAGDTIKGRSATTGAPQDLSAANTRSLLNVADGAQPTSTALVDAAGAIMHTDIADDGILVRTAAETYVPRTIAATAPATITNGDGKSGNPTVGLTIATQEQAEAGLASNVLMTPQRTAQAIAANTSGITGVRILTGQSYTGNPTTDKGLIVLNAFFTLEGETSVFNVTFGRLQVEIDGTWTSVNYVAP